MISIRKPKTEASRLYALWVMPKGPLAVTLQTMITHLARTYDGPVFEPHVTVLGGIPNLTEKEAIEKTSLLATKLTPYEVRFDRIGMFDEYHRALFIRMKEDEKTDEAFLRAERMFHHTDYPRYLPHLSLFYGNHPVEKKNQMIADVTIDPGQSFVADTLHLYSYTTGIESLKRIASFPLKSAGSMMEL